MKAVVTHRYGGPEVLKLEQLERPVPGRGEILVKVHSSVVTQGDRRLRAADFPGVAALFGRLALGVFAPRAKVGGTMFAGRIVQVGPGVERFSVGDDVFGSAMSGAHAEYLRLGEDQAVAALPFSIDPATAAAAPYGAGTALTFLRDLAKLQRGERVLIVGASGGVGLMAVQIARHLGARVSAVCRRGAELVKDLGASEVIDYRKEDVTARDERWDVILDLTEGDHFRSYQGNLSQTGRYLSVYVTPRLLMESLLTRWRKGPRALTGIAMERRAIVEDVAALLASGALKPIIAERVALAEIQQAHRLLEQPRAVGTVVVEIHSPAPARSTERKSSSRLLAASLPLLAARTAARQIA